MKMKRFAVEFVLVLTIILVTMSCGSETPEPAVEPTQPQSGEPGIEPYPGPGQDVIQEDKPVPQGVEPYPEPQDLTSAEPGVMVIPTDHEYAPVSGDEQLTRGDVLIDESEIILLESYPVQVKLQLAGNLPTPCHILRAVVSPPDKNNHIQVEVYSLSDPEQMCTQVLEPFTASLPLGSYTEGAFKVWVNEVEIGEIKLP
jgi:hypothetical protein